MLYFNSTYAKYFQFNFSSAWGLKYDDILDNELYSLPNIFDFLNNEVKLDLLTLIDKILSIKKSNEVNQNILHLEEEILTIYKGQFLSIL